MYIYTVYICHNKYMDKMIRTCNSPVNFILNNDFKSMFVECRSPKFYVKKYNNIIDILKDIHQNIDVNMKLYKNNVLIFHPSGIKIILEFEIMSENNFSCLKINSPIFKNKELCNILDCSPQDKYVKIVENQNFNIFYSYIKSILTGIYNYNGYIPYDINLEKTIDMVNSMIICEINRLSSIIEDEDKDNLKNDMYNQIDLWCNLQNWNGQKYSLHPGINGVKYKISSHLDEISNKIINIISNEHDYMYNESTKKIIMMLNFQFNYWIFLLESLKN